MNEYTIYIYIHKMHDTTRKQRLYNHDLDIQ